MAKRKKGVRAAGAGWAVVLLGVMITTMGTQLSRSWGRGW